VYVQQILVKMVEPVLTQEQARTINARVQTDILEVLVQQVSFLQKRCSPSSLVYFILL
jgi:hypothetical protein